MLSAGPVFQSHRRRDACTGTATRIALPRYMPASSRTRSTATAGNAPWSVVERDDQSRAARARARRRAARTRASGRSPFARRSAFDARRRSTLDAAPRDRATTATRTFPFGLGWHPFFPAFAATPSSSFAPAASGRPTPPACRHDTPRFRRAWDFCTPRAIGDDDDRQLLHRLAAPAIVALARRADRRSRSSADAACDHLVVYVPPGPRLHRRRAGHAHDRRVQPRRAGQRRTPARDCSRPGQPFLVRCDLSVVDTTR